MPAMIAVAAMLFAVMPDPQNRSSVTPLALHVVAGVERGHAAEVAALLAHLRAGAPHDVVDVGGVEPVALDERGEHRRRQVLGMEMGEGALPLLADAPRGAAGVDDQCVRHGGAAPSVEWRRSRVQCGRAPSSPTIPEPPRATQPRPTPPEKCRESRAQRTIPDIFR